MTSDQAITVRGIVRTYLEKHCYDGLFSGTGCACVLDDLMPCSCEGVEFCEAGHIVRNCVDPDCEGCAEGGYHVEKGARA